MNKGFRASHGTKDPPNELTTKARESSTNVKTNESRKKGITHREMNGLGLYIIYILSIICLPLIPF